MVVFLRTCAAENFVSGVPGVMFRDSRDFERNISRGRFRTRYVLQNTRRFFRRLSIRTTLTLTNDIKCRDYFEQRLYFFAKTRLKKQLPELTVVIEYGENV